MYSNNRNFDSLQLLFRVSLAIFLVYPFVNMAQNEACCARAFRACGVCQPDPDPLKRTDNLTYEFCGVTGYYGQLPNSAGASAKLKACQKCIDATCPVGVKGEPEVDKSKIVQVRRPDKEYSFCKNAFTTVVVEKKPNPDDLVAMAVVETDGSTGDEYTVEERGRFPGRSLVVVPPPPNGTDYGAWVVRVLFGGTAEAKMTADSYIRLPCFQRETVREKIEAAIEVSGGFTQFLLDTLKNNEYRDVPEVYNINTRYESIGVIDINVEVFMRPPTDLNIVNAAYMPPVAERIELTIDERTPGVSTVSVRGADLNIKPVNTSLRPFVLRSGQKVSITRTSVGAVTPIAGGGISSGCGIGRRWDLTNEYGARAVWTRIGNSSVFDARYTYPDGSVFDEKPVVTLNGKNITARVDYNLIATSCTFVGTLAPDGRTASGTFTCSTSPGKAAKWNAEIFCQ